MKVIKSLFYFSISLFSVFIFFEFFLKFATILDPIVRIDPIKGERYFPNKLSNSLFVSEGFGLGKTNLHGWFGKEYTNDSSEISIGIIGNSYVASRQVFTRDNFVSLSEKNINSAHEDFKVSIYNFGKESMPISELLYIKEEVVEDFKLDYAVILLNDQSFLTASRFVPYYTLSNDSLVLNTSFKQAPIVEISNSFSYLSQSSLMFLAYRVKNKLPLAYDIIFDKFYSDEDVYSSKTKIEKHEINNINGLIIRKLDADSRVIFLLDVKPNTKELLKSLIIKSPVIDLSQTLSEVRVKNGVDPNYWPVTNEYGHWNYAAHSAIAKDISDELVRIIKLDKNGPK